MSFCNFELAAIFPFLCSILIVHVYPSNFREWSKSTGGGGGGGWAGGFEKGVA